MGKLSWSWLLKEILPPKRRESAPPVPSINYDPNSHRPEYLQAFDEFKQRGSLYNQMTIREESEESGSQSTNTNTATGRDDSNGVQTDRPKSDATERHSLPNRKTRSMFGGSPHRKANTANNTLTVNENNNSIYVDEILDFEGNCINDASFGATSQSPPKTFYRNNSNPFSPEAQKPVNIQSESSSALIQSESSSAPIPSVSSTVPIPSASSSAQIQSASSSARIQTASSSAQIQTASSSAQIQTASSSAPRTVTKIEGSRQRACQKLLSYIRPNARKSENSSNSSGAYRQYDLDSISLDGEEEVPKKSNGQNIPKNMYDEIVNAFGDVAQSNGSRDERDKHNSPAPQPTEHGSCGVSPLSAFASFRRCEGVIDENFGFLNDTEWRRYCMDESKVESESCAANAEELSIDVTDLDEFAERLIDLSEMAEQRSGNIDSVTSSPASKHPIFIIECKAKDIKPKSSALRNTMPTPFQLSSGSFRQTTVTLKKCCPRDSASIRLVEEAIERDYEILSKVKHPNIVILMAACFNRNLINHMTLIMEPVDYTLNFYLHQMDKAFTVLECISIVQQIGSAALYLQECGYIHSNISSHNVLFRERPCSVKLSSFELATDANYATVRAEVEKCCPQSRASPSGESSRNQQSTGTDEDNVGLKRQYKELSKRLASLKRSTNAEHDYMDIPSKYLVYDPIYRQHLSMHNVTAPELLAIDQRFVFPTPKTDVYSLCLLLWELLNQCVPFAVYNRLDMQRMIAANKLNLPFFERERCFIFMDIFGAGLAIQPENRSMDVSHLIERLDDIELEILTGGEDFLDESSDCNGESAEHVMSQQEQSECSDDSVIRSSPSQQSLQLSGNHLNTLSDFVLSPSLLDFDKSLTERERTSTKKMRKKPTREHVAHRIRELFPSVNETGENATANDKDHSSFVDLLNESFIELSDDIRRHVFDDIDEDEKLNENLAELAEGIRRNILSDTDEFTSNEYQPMEVHSKRVAEPRKSNTVPTVVGFSVKNKKLNDSKTHGNLLDTPTVTTAAKKLFNFPPNEYDFNSERHDGWPNFARQNYIKRNAWLSNQEPNMSNKDNEHQADENDKEKHSVDVSKKVNVSVRIVHNKMTPEKAVRVTPVQPKDVHEERPSSNVHEERPSKNVHEVRPSILSKIKFFDSANQTSKTGISVSNDKHTIAPVKVSSNKPTNSSDKTVNERVAVAVATKDRKCADKNVVPNDAGKDERKSIMNELTDAMHNLHNGPLDPPQKKQLFEKKLWKRELDICNRSLNSSDGANESKNLNTNFRSVKDTILKFEKRDEVTRSQPTSNSSSTSAESVKSAPKPNSLSQANHQNDSPTMIKRTVYSEQIVSGIGLSPLDFFNFGGKKMGTSMRQVRQTSSDVGVNGRTDVRFCGSEVELLSFNAGTFNSSGLGPSGAITVCFNCASMMSSDELKALTYEPLNTSVNSDSNLLQESPTRRCQARVKSQDTRSIEDLYIDDDFVHELGANMELQSNYSDSLDFDMVSSGLY